jgi:hypothetical protein
VNVIAVVMTNVARMPRGVAAAFVLGLLAALFLQAVLRLASPESSRLVLVLRVLLGVAAAGVAWVYGLAVSPWLRLDVSTAGAFLAGLLLVSGWALVKAARRDRLGDSLPRWLGHAAILALALVAGLATLLTAGLLNLVRDKPVLVVDVTGETGLKVVRWAPPDSEMRTEALITHHVLFRRPSGEPVAEAWLYGDEVAVKGRVLRLSPTLNAAGLPNLFELTFAHNGYATAERHNAMPHEAVALPPLGSLAVHPLWRPLQASLQAAWQTKLDPEGVWGVRASTIESTYFPLVDPDGKPVSRSYRLVLTPGGLTSS